MSNARTRAESTVTEDKRDYVGIALWITSDELSPEMITDVVGIEPNYTQVRGTPIKGVDRLYERHSWKLGERLYAREGDYIGNHSEQFFDAFLNRIKDIAPRIKELSKYNEVSVALIYNVRDMPYIGLTREQVQVLAALGARVDHDVMVYGGS
jgi:hypothetical protein